MIEDDRRKETELTREWVIRQVEDPGFEDFQRQKKIDQQIWQGLQTDPGETLRALTSACLAIGMVPFTPGTEDNENE